MPKILITNPYHWESAAHVGMHHYTRYFARFNWDAAFISEPISPLHFIYPRTFSTTCSKFKTWRKGGKVTEEGVFSYTPMTLLPAREMPLLRSQFACKNSIKFTVPNLLKFLRKKDFGKVDVLWNDSTRYYQLSDEIEHKISIIRIPDEIKLFQTLPMFLKGKEEEIIKRADIVITVSRTLMEKLSQLRKGNLYYVPNGVDFEHFSQAEWHIPHDIHVIPEPRIIFIGVIGNWVDWELIKHAAKMLPSFQFVFIGPVQIKTGTSKNNHNIHLLGSRDYSQIPNYLKSCQVGILPFHRTEFVDSIHPIKLYEYMACGLPVVATNWREMMEIGSPAYLAENYEEFVTYLQKAVELSNDTTEREKLIDYASMNTWKSRFEEVLRIINKQEEG
ncbi:glycosyltransferase [bacterium]|nr:glycosyltransferase [bacterium]